MSEVLAEYVQQKKTRTFAGIPRHVFYYQYRKRLAKNPEIKKWSEDKIEKNKPVIYDSTLAQTTTEEFVKYMKLRGYRSAAATYSAQTVDKETHVTYTLNPGPLMIVDSFIYLIQDSAISKIVLEPKNLKNSVLKDNSPLDINLYDAERIRITRLLLDEGYADFSTAAIGNLQVDTTGGRIIAKFPINNKEDSTRFLVHEIGTVTIYPDGNLPAERFYDTTYNRILYKLHNEPVFTLKPEIIDRNLFIRSGNIARQSDLSKTIRSLSRMATMRNIIPVAKIDNGDTLVPRIDYTFPLDRNLKIELGGGIDLTYSNLAAMERISLFGVGGQLTYQDRNIFNGGEVFNLNAETGFEFNFFENDEDGEEAERNLINSTNNNIAASIGFPRFMDPLKLYSIIGSKREGVEKAKIGNKVREWLDIHSVTRVNTSYNYTFIRNYLKSYTFTANLQYDIKPDDSRHLTIDRLGFDFFVPTPQPGFEEILKENTFLREQYNKTLFTGLLFRGYTYTQITDPGKHTGNFTFTQSFEISGLEVLGANLLANAISRSNHQWAIGKTDPAFFSHFVKGELTLIYKRDFSRLQLACRANTGIATTFGPFSKQVPYLKQFFVGGPNSNRGWQIRELGPGSYEDENVDPTLQFYQVGDFKIDLSTELRFNLFWLLKGAVFVDAGNVWTLKKDEQRPGTTVGSLFQELGVSYGYGVRLDLSFFIFRLDIGYKLFNPYPIDGTRLAKSDLRKFPLGGEPQIAVGLPF